MKNRSQAAYQGRPRRGTDGSSSDFGAVNGSFSPDGTRIVTGSDDGTAKIWNARPGVPRFDIGGDQQVLAAA